MARSGFDGDRDDGVWGSALWVTRDQFVHFVTLAHQHAEPSDWPSFRLELVAALNAAWGLDTRWGHRTTAQNDWVAEHRHRHALAVLDEVRARFDPANDWPAFFNALWEARDAIRTDVVPPMPPASSSMRPVQVPGEGRGHLQRPRRAPPRCRRHRRPGSSE